MSFREGDAGRLCPIWAIVATVIGGCVGYRPLPLDTRPRAPIDLAAVRVDAGSMPLAALQQHRFDPSDGLDIDETAMLAVANNPELRIARDDAGIARAQAFAAGLLPDPVIDISGDHPTANVAGSNINGFGLGLSYDINALLRRSAEKASATAAQQRAGEELLWKEWQTVALARLLFVRNVEGARNLELLKQERDLFKHRQARLRRALDAGNVTIDSVATDYAGLSDVQQKLAEQERKLNQSRHDLDALLGLATDSHPTLVRSATLPAVDAGRLRALIPRIGSLRPDLRALEAGYRSQDEKYRAAVMAQFPALSMGFNRARDTSGIYSTGFSLSLSLPIFNRNRGNIAIENATRQRLYDEYQARLSMAVSDIDAILDDRVLAQRQLAQVRQGVEELARLAAHLQSAYEAGNIDVIAYVTQRDALLAKRMEELALEQSLLEQQISLQTLFGSQIPSNATTATPQ